MTRLVEWAEANTVSAIWSCLAAHAAVHHIDGITRRPLGAKLCGVFECTRTADHPVANSGLARWPVPHSRYNELPEAALAARGYLILARSAAAGADMFVKQRKSLFLFLQGHPEYDAGALLREYRRDVARFLTGESDSYPDIPRGYFDDSVAGTLWRFRDHALRHRNSDLLSDFPTAQAAQTLVGVWHDAAVRLYASWLAYLVERKSDRRSSSYPLSRAHPRLPARPAEPVSLAR
jgi:homoserine O-succinyltransferase